LEGVGVGGWGVVPDDPVLRKWLNWHTFHNAPLSKTTTSPRKRRIEEDRGWVRVGVFGYYSVPEVVHSKCLASLEAPA